MRHGKERARAIPDGGDWSRDCFLNSAYLNSARFDTVRANIYDLGMYKFITNSPSSFVIYF